MLNTKYLIFDICIFLCFFSITKCEICKKRVNLQRWVPESFYRTVRETYRGRCFFRCTKTRINSYYDERIVLKTTFEYRDECCPGYTEDLLKSHLEGKLQCKPICSPACEQGFCKTPGLCVCYKGYEVHPTDTHRCLPICTNGCAHGSCIGPETCKCDFGYELKNNACQPICTDPCVNATCVAPDTCECLSGYRRTDNNLCFPYCSSGCTNGVCISPENCSCNDGWYKAEEVCAPQCDFECGGGKCISPNYCECRPNYDKAANGTCVPHCSQGCLNGKCVSPDNCVCDEGWIKDDQLNSTLCVPECIGCNGTCVAPKHCACEIPFKAVDVTEDGHICNCHESCSEGHKQCHHIACIFNDTYYTSTTDIISPSTEDSIMSTIFDEVSYDSGATDNIFDDVSSSTSFYDTDALRKTDKNYGIPFWVYIMITSIMIILVILSITICSRKVILHYCKGSSYVVEDDNT